MMASNNNFTIRINPQHIQNSNIKLLYLNVNGIKEKLYEILDLAGVQKAEIIIINETRLTSKDWLRATGFKVYRNNRPTPSGGTAILVSNNIDSQEIPLPADLQDPLTTPILIHPLSIRKTQFSLPHYIPVQLQISHSVFHSSPFYNTTRM